MRLLMNGIQTKGIEYHRKELGKAKRRLVRGLRMMTVDKRVT